MTRRGCNCCGGCQNDIEVSSWSGHTHTDNGNGSATWTNGELTCGQKIASGREAYELRFSVDKNCTIHVEGFEIDVDITNQDITLGLNTRTFADPSGASGDTAHITIYVCPTFIYVTAENIDTTTDFTTVDVLTGTCLTASRSGALVRTWSIESTETSITVAGWQDDDSPLIKDQTVKYSGATLVEDCDTQLRFINSHYGHLDERGDVKSDLTFGGFDHSTPPTGWSGTSRKVNEVATESPEAVSSDELAFGAPYDTMGWHCYRGWFGTVPGPTDQFANVHEAEWLIWATVEMVRDAHTSGTPYPEPRYEVTLTIDDGGPCWNSGTGLKQGSWERDGQTVSNVDVNDMDTGWLINAETDTFSNCGAGTVPYNPTSSDTETSEGETSEVDWDF